jgi:hypothetical protein
MPWLFAHVLEKVPENIRLLPAIEHSACFLVDRWLYFVTWNRVVLLPGLLPVFKGYLPLQ